MSSLRELPEIVYTPSCVSFFYAPNCIDAPPKFNSVNASSCILFFLHKQARDLTENYYKRLHYHTDLN